MGAIGRDLGILAVLVVLGLLWSLYSVVTRRHHRMVAKAERHAQERERGEEQPVPGLEGYSTSVGWAGPGSDPPPDEGTRDYVREMTLTFAGEATVLRHDRYVIGDTRYVNVFHGEADGRRMRLGNAYVNLRLSTGGDTDSGTDHAVSFVAVDLPTALPPLVVALRAFPPYSRPLVKEWTLESEDFNRRFLVMALDTRYVSDVVGPQLMELLMARDDWVFLLEMTRLVCVCSSPFQDVDDVRERVGAVSRFADLVPSFVTADRGLALPRLPDGTPFDPRDKASLERLKAAYATMTPDERRAFVADAQASGARWVLGAFGKEPPPVD